MPALTVMVIIVSGSAPQWGQTGQIAVSVMIKPGSLPMTGMQCR